MATLGPSIRDARSVFPPVLLPAPRIGAYRIEAARRAPSEHVLRARGVRVACSDVPCASRSERPRDAATTGALERGDDVQHRTSAAEPEVQCRGAAVPCEVAQRRHMARGKVLHMEIVAHAGAV